jgi:hypothetical protein
MTSVMLVRHIRARANEIIGRGRERLLVSIILPFTRFSILISLPSMPLGLLRRFFESLVGVPQVFRQIAGGAFSARRVGRTIDG